MKLTVGDSKPRHLREFLVEMIAERATNPSTFLVGEFMSVHDRADSFKVGG
jgi:hypothetical protein